MERPPNGNRFCPRKGAEGERRTEERSGPSINLGSARSGGPGGDADRHPHRPVVPVHGRNDVPLAGPVETRRFGGKAPVPLGGCQAGSGPPDAAEERPRYGSGAPGMCPHAGEPGCVSAAFVGVSTAMAIGHAPRVDRTGRRCGLDLEAGRDVLSARCPIPELPTYDRASVERGARDAWARKRRESGLGPAGAMGPETRLGAELPVGGSAGNLPISFLNCRVHWMQSTLTRHCPSRSPGFGDGSGSVIPNGDHRRQYPLDFRPREGR